MMRGKFTISEYQKLRLKVSLLLLVVPILVGLILCLYFYAILEMNFLLFKAFTPDQSEVITQDIYQFLYQSVPLYVSFIAAILILNLFWGLHIAARLVRPFRRISEFCQKSKDNSSIFYEPDFFSDFKFLTSFTDYFFTHVQEARQKKRWSSQTIPPHYSKVRGPVFERSYFLSLFFAFGFLTFMTMSFFYFWTEDFHSELINIFMEHFKRQGLGEIYFIKEQKRIFNIALWVSSGLFLFGYSVLIAYFYQMASSAAFAFFATFKAFMRGQMHSRIHLLGHQFLRDYGREVNQYLKVVQRELPLSTDEKKLPTEDEDAA